MGFWVTLMTLSNAAPYIVEEGGNKSLYFGHDAVQSSMRTNDPYFLDLEYTRMMMGFLLFNASPRRIAMIGLGGGSLAKFCHKHLPSEIQIAEINASVLQLRNSFVIPKDSDRFQIVLADGSDFIYQNRDFDVILVDGYGREGLPEALCTASFYRNCYRALAPGGVAVFNLVPFSPRYLERCGRIFSAFGNCHSFQDWEGLNNVVIAARGVACAQIFEVPKDWSSANELSSTLDRMYAAQAQVRFVDLNTPTD